MVLTLHPSISDTNDSNQEYDSDDVCIYGYRYDKEEDNINRLHAITYLPFIDRILCFDE